MKNKICFITLLLIAVFALNGKAQITGDNDPTFNVGDFGFNAGGGSNNEVDAVTIQPNGKIIIGGKFTSYNATPINRIARLNTGGRIDTTFNSGTGIQGLSTTSTSVKAIAVQSDGKIVIGGNFNTYNGTTRLNIARINVDGS